MAKVWVGCRGGLGNQLFQYAAGRALAKRLNAELCLDISYYEVQTKEYPECTFRSYELPQILGLRPSTCTIAEIAFARVRPFLPNRERKSILANLKRKLCYKIYGFMIRSTLLGYRDIFSSSYTYFQEPHLHYTPNWAKLSGSVYLKGYWQSERYFKQITSELRRELSLDRFESKRTAAVLSKIKKPYSVSIHFRRRDNFKWGWVLPLVYYTRALDLLKRLTQEELCLYIFSDDVEELKTLLPEVVKNTCLPYELVSGQGYSSYEEMMLMSHCQHHIMANSTYSWWGTWLHDRSADDRPGEKYVIAPRIWFPEGSHNATHLNFRDTYCEDWISI